MALEVKRKENESPATLLFRFSKKVRQSGILAETRRRRSHLRSQNKRKRRLSAIYRADKKVEMQRKKKLGLLV